MFIEALFITDRKWEHSELYKQTVMPIEWDTVLSHKNE